VEVSVLIQKIKIDTRSQVATIRWWLRQTWKDVRLSWDPAAYSFHSGTEVETLDSITRPPGTHGGLWIPDLILWDSDFAAYSSQVQTGIDGPTRLEINHTGTVFWSVPQEVHIEMVPRMVMDRFPFDVQDVVFTLGPWANSVKAQNTTFPADSGRMFVNLLGQEGFGDGSSFDSCNQDVNNFVATEEWIFETAFANRCVFERASAQERGREPESASERASERTRYRCVCVCDIYTGNPLTNFKACNKDVPSKTVHHNL